MYIPCTVLFSGDSSVDVNVAFCVGSIGVDQLVRSLACYLFLESLCSLSHSHHYFFSYLDGVLKTVF